MITAEWFNGVFQALSACIAGLVLWQAIQIKHNQNVQKHNSAWNDFNKIMLTDDNLKLYNDFIYRNQPDKYNPENKVNWIIFCKLNILEGIILDMKNNSIPFERGCEILIDQAVLIRRRANYMNDLMIDRGYGSELIKLMRSYFHTGSDEEFKATLAKICSNRLLRNLGF